MATEQERMMDSNNNEFDLTIGRLDRVLSKLVLWGRASDDPFMDEANRQTLKHHAEDMIAAGQKILRDLKVSGSERELADLNAANAANDKLRCPSCGYKNCSGAIHVNPYRNESEDPTDAIFKEKCTRATGHDGPCNGLPQPSCLYQEPFRADRPRMNG